MCAPAVADGELEVEWHHWADGVGSADIATMTQAAWTDLGGWMSVPWPPLDCTVVPGRGDCIVLATTTPGGHRCQLRVTIASHAHAPLAHDDFVELLCRAHAAVVTGDASLNEAMVIAAHRAVGLPFSYVAEPHKAMLGRDLTASISTVPPEHAANVNAAWCFVSPPPRRGGSAGVGDAHAGSTSPSWKAVTSSFSAWAAAVLQLRGTATVAPSRTADGDATAGVPDDGAGGCAVVAPGHGRGEMRCTSLEGRIAWACAALAHAHRRCEDEGDSHGEARV